jgi:hypothetical protein
MHFLTITQSIVGGYREYTLRSADAGGGMR